jgi:hypothetical protein
MLSSRAMDVDAELIGQIERQDIATKMANAHACIAIEINRHEEHALLRFRLQKQLFFSLDSDHAVGVAKLI